MHVVVKELLGRELRYQDMCLVCGSCMGCSDISGRCVIGVVVACTGNTCA